MTIIERVAARLGFYRAPPAELVVFRSHESARDAGFRNSRLPEHPEVHGWWPGLGPAGLMGRPYKRVTIPRDMAYYETGEGYLVEILRRRQMTWGHRAIWVEL